MIVALSMIIPMILFQVLWIALLMALDPIGRQMPNRSHPKKITFEPPARPANPKAEIVALLEASQTLSAVELYIDAYGSTFEEAHIKVLKIEAQLWD